MPRGQLLDDCILKHRTVTHIMHHSVTALITNLVHKRSLFSSVIRPWHLQVHIFFSIEQSNPPPKCDVPTRSGWPELACYITSIHSHFGTKHFASRVLSVFWDMTLSITFHKNPFNCFRVVYCVLTHRRTAHGCERE